MNRREILKLLGLVPTGVLIASCEKKLPKTTTYVFGKVVDGSGAPLEGAGISLDGYDQKFSTGTTTFQIVTVTDKNGAFSLSYLIPKNTDKVGITFYPTRFVTTGNPEADNAPAYEPYYLIDGKPEIIFNPIQVPKDNWGKTYNINFLFKKI